LPDQVMVINAQGVIIGLGFGHHKLRKTP
jgi:hypothetical protein